MWRRELQLVESKCLNVQQVVTCHICLRPCKYKVGSMIDTVTQPLPCSTLKDHRVSWFPASLTLKVRGAPTETTAVSSAHAASCGSWCHPIPLAPSGYRFSKTLS